MSAGEGTAPLQESSRVVATAFARGPISRNASVGFGANGSASIRDTYLEILMTVPSFETLEHRLVPSTLTVRGVAHQWLFRLDSQTTPPTVDVRVQRTVTDQASIDFEVKTAYEKMMKSPYPKFVNDLKYDLNLAEDGVTFKGHYSEAFVMQFRDDAILGGKGRMATRTMNPHRRFCGTSTSKTCCRPRTRSTSTRRSRS